MDICLRLLKESNKRRFDSYSDRKSVLNISHMTFRIVTCTFFPQPCSKQLYISNRFFETQPIEICSHLSEKASKGRFLKREKLQNHSNEGKGKEKKKERGEGKDDKKKKQWLHSQFLQWLLWVCGRKNCWTEKVHLALTFSKIRLDFSLMCLQLTEVFHLHLGRKSYYFKGLYQPPPRRVLGRPIKTFKSRLFARRRCEKIAKYGRYRVFALQYGRYCYVTRLRRKFVMYGRSKSRGLGAIKVYQRTNGKPSSLRLM